MRLIPVLVVSAIALAGVLASAQVAVAGPDQAAIDELNQIRRAHGLRALRASDSLHRSSSHYAHEMLRRDYFGHGPRIEVSSRFGAAGETLAWHSGWNARPRRTVHLWMGSPSHRAVLLSPRYRWVGMGVARGRMAGRVATTWVAHVGSR